MQGKAFKFGDNISTDHIAPGRLFHLRSDLQEFAKHVLEDADENFAKQMQKGDFVVAGSNFGLGSSREHAPQIIKIAGVLIFLSEISPKVPNTTFSSGSVPLSTTQTGVSAERYFIISPVFSLIFPIPIKIIKVSAV